MVINLVLWLMKWSRNVQNNTCDHTAKIPRPKAARTSLTVQWLRICLPKKKKKRICLPAQGVRVQSLVQKLRSHILHGAAKAKTRTTTKPKVSNSNNSFISWDRRNFSLFHQPSLWEAGAYLVMLSLILTFLCSFLVGSL